MDRISNINRQFFILGRYMRKVEKILIQSSKIILWKIVKSIEVEITRKSLIKIKREEKTRILDIFNVTKRRCRNLA